MFLVPNSSANSNVYSTKRYAIVQNKIRRTLSGQKEAIICLKLSVDKMEKSLTEFMTYNETVKEFITEADANLKTILNEYEVNGIPLGYDRKGLPEEHRRIDYYEGL